MLKGLNVPYSFKTHIEEENVFKIIVLTMGKTLDEGMITKSTYRQIYKLNFFQMISYNINLNQMTQVDQSTQNKLQIHRGSQKMNQIHDKGNGAQINLQIIQNKDNLNSQDIVKNDRFWTKKRKIILIFFLFALSILITVTTVLCVPIIDKKKYKSPQKARQIILVDGQVIEVKILKSTNSSYQLISTKLIKKEKERLLQTEEKPQVLVHEIWNEQQVIVTVGNDKQIIHALDWSQAQMESEIAQLGNNAQETVESIAYSTYIYKQEKNKYELQEDNKINQNLRRVLYQKRPTKWIVEDAQKNIQNILKQQQKYLNKDENYEGTLGPDDRKETGKEFLSNCFPKSKNEIICKNQKQNEQIKGRKPRSWQITIRSFRSYRSH